MLKMIHPVWEKHDLMERALVDCTFNEGILREDVLENGSDTRRFYVTARQQSVLQSTFPSNGTYALSVPASTNAPKSDVASSASSSDALS